MHVSHLQDTEQGATVDVKASRRGRPSRTAEEATEDESKEAEKPEETPSRRRRRSAAKEATAGELLTVNELHTVDMALAFNTQNKQSW